MFVEVPMPSLGLTMTEGVVVEWLKEQGDVVEEGEPLFLLETEKTTIEINASVSGVLAKIILPVGEPAPVGQLIALIETEEDEAVSDSLTREISASEKETLEVSSRSAEGSQYIDHSDIKKSADDSETKIRATPIARRLAQEAGIDLSSIHGTGRNGMISREDVENAVTQRNTSPQGIDEEIRPLSGIRAVIAERMARSARTTAPVTLSAEADATELVVMRNKLTEEWKPLFGITPSYNDILVAILTIGLTEFPQVNAHLLDNEIHILHSIHIGVAVDTERGLVVPVLRNCADKKLVDITRSLKELVARAQSGSLLPDELTGGTFTLTNLGMYGIDFFTPIINLPETAILGVGKITAVPSVINGQIEIRDKLTLSLTFDHRTIDGALAARFLQRIVQLIDQIDKTSLVES